LLKLTGARVQMIEQCAGVDGLLGLRAEAAAQSSAAGEALGAQIRTVGDDVVVGDCHLSNMVIREQTSIRPSHPLQILASAYGIEVPRDEH
jgi:Fe-S oxidoreductase